MNEAQAPHTPKLARFMSYLNSETGSHAIALAICLGILILAALLHQQGSSTRGIFLANFKLPPMCTFNIMTGLDCPGCGLTRSFVAAMHGDLTKSFARHRLGPFCVFYVFLQIGRQIWWLFSGPDKTHVTRWGRRLDLGLLGIAVLLFLNWTLKMFGI